MSKIAADIDGAFDRLNDENSETDQSSSLGDVQSRMALMKNVFQDPNSTFHLHNAHAPAMSVNTVPRPAPPQEIAVGVPLSSSSSSEDAPPPLPPPVQVAKPPPQPKPEPKKDVPKNDSDQLSAKCKYFIPFLIGVIEVFVGSIIGLVGYVSTMWVGIALLAKGSIFIIVPILLMRCGWRNQKMKSRAKKGMRRHRNKQDDSDEGEVSIQIGQAHPIFPKTVS